MINDPLELKLHLVILQWAKINNQPPLRTVQWRESRCPNPTSKRMHENMEEDERKVVNEFCHLLEKSKQLFNGLRDMPQYGHKQWQAYFGRTFDIYTKLWKFQQQHRPILDRCPGLTDISHFLLGWIENFFNKTIFRKYGLKRWQIGEIASKIGQLYYHY